MIAIELKSISKSFTQGDKKIEILKNFNLQIHAGRTLAVVGPSGSGKSTLLSLIAGLDTADSGEVFVFDQKITQMNESEMSTFRSKNMGIIFQQFHLFPYLTAEENVALPLQLAGDQQAFEKARETLDKVGLKNRANHLPHQLSGGENQRVAIARSFAVQPKIILADEPSGSLDQKSGDSVMNLLFDLVKNDKSTLVLVTHNIDLAQKSDSIFEFKRASN